MENRTRNSLLNMLSGISYQGITAFLNVFIRKFFIQYIGILYLGFDGFFANIIAMMSLLDFGIATSASFFLSKELAKKSDEREILETYYSFNFLYKFIASLMVILGIIICLNLKLFVSSDTYSLGFLQTIFILQFSRTISNFLLSTPRIAMQCMQRNYENITIDVICSIVFSILKILVIINLKNYQIYLVLLLIEVVSSNLIIRSRFKKVFKKGSISKSTNIESIKKILGYSKNIAVLNISDFIYRSTDNIIIAYFSGMEMVGLLSNYYYVFTTIDALYTQLYFSISASVTNFIHDDSVNTDDNKNRIFNLMSFLAFTMGAFCITFLSLLTGPFISVFFGNKYVLDVSIVLLLAMNFSVTILHGPLTIFINAIGKADMQSKYSIMSTLMNLFISICSYPFLGVKGVLLGTFISNSIYYLFRMKIIKKYCFENYDYYFHRLIIYAATFLLIMIFSGVVVTRIEYTWITFMLLIVIGIGLYSLIIFFYRKTYEFSNLYNIIMNELMIVRNRTKKGSS
ncbi:MAG: lipopolysaccharide biosynthesis protein [Erysipelotrichales bacterium]|nr:lipopolysaccharide biosynthesis protein [Erysipelotrichales bacterium]